MFFKKYGRSPIARKLLFITIGVSTLIAFIITISQLVYDYYQDIQRIERTLQQIKIASVPSIVVSLWNLDDEQVKVQLQSLLKVSEVIRVEVNIPNKKSVVYGEEASEDFFLKKYDFELLYTRDDSTEISLGVLRVFYDFENIYIGLLEKLVFIFLLNCLKTLAVSFVILFVFWKLVTNHIVNISDQLDRHKEILLNKELVVLTDQENLGEINTLINSINKLCNYVIDVKTVEEEQKQAQEDKPKLLKDEYIADYGLLQAKHEKNFARSVVFRVNNELANILNDCENNINEISMIYGAIGDIKEMNIAVDELLKELKVVVNKTKQIITSSMVFSDNVSDMFRLEGKEELVFFYKNDLIDIFKETSSFLKRNHLVIEEDIIFSAESTVLSRLLWVVFYLIYQLDNPSSLKTSAYKKNMDVVIVVSYAMSTIQNKTDRSSPYTKLAFELYVIELFVQQELKGSFSYEVNDDTGISWIISFPLLV
ncbi:hypothetical protein H0A36_19270 [Endozoicomonas sp. SM1973]|uniref:Periplasmic sensor domain-containing protein n=1 Tax=Spartinivicinus marinus TaxID=2994442 RepID=A0A853I8W0_9GAMM|nr:hypothetical protein [Spartinivicinus marinus]MCX4029323.1 hypothetical protein [Spartinivicinus marinus]NYZ68162.1 hypothetical protein [Spartinivicinus marinus]